MVKVRKIVVRVDKDNAEIFHAEKVELEEDKLFILDADDIPLAVFLVWQYWRYQDEPRKKQQGYDTWGNITITGTDQGDWHPLYLGNTTDKEKA